MSESMPTEEWRPIPDMPDYEVSSLGRVRSWKKRRSDAKDKPVEPRIMKLQFDANGYVRVGIGNGYYVHRLVCAAWHGAPVKGTEVHHINEIRADNRPENLEWTTHLRNLLHKQDARCDKGHPLTAESIYTKPDGTVCCRECRREQMREYQRTLRAESNHCTKCGQDLPPWVVAS